MLTKNLVLCSNSQGQFPIWTLNTLYTFLLHNQGWKITLLDVGLTKEDHDLFSKIVIIKAPLLPGRYPAAVARCFMLKSFCRPNMVLLYLDSDTWINESLEIIIEKFVTSGKAIGIY